MATVLKLISLNLEEDRHYPEALGLLAAEKPDVICLQEMPHSFISHLNEAGYFVNYAPLFKRENYSPSKEIGIGIATLLPNQGSITYYYSNHPAPRKNSTEVQPSERWYGLLGITIRNEIGNFPIYTTHAPVTNDGLPDQEQDKALNRLLTHLDTLGPHVLCGDFNMPRNVNNLYNKFTERYLDNIPAVYKSSLDRNLHKNGLNEIDKHIFDSFMVDYIFTKSPYGTKEVRLEFGVSDHAAIIATIEKHV